MEIEYLESTMKKIQIFEIVLFVIKPRNHIIDTTKLVSPPTKVVVSIICNGLLNFPLR